MSDTQGNLGLTSLVTTLQNNAKSQTAVMNNLIAAIQAAFPQASAEIVGAPGGAATAGLKITVGGTAYVVALYAA